MIAMGGVQRGENVDVKALGGKTKEEKMLLEMAMVVCEQNHRR